MKLNNIKIFPAQRGTGWGLHRNQEVIKRKGNIIVVLDYDDYMDEFFERKVLIMNLLPEVVSKAYIALEVNGVWKLILKNKSFQEEADLILNEILEKGIQLYL